MSLDVYLELESVQSAKARTIIPFREGGRIVELTREEWDTRFPNREPMLVEIPPDNKIVYSANITHNLGGMANEASIYKHLWRPEELGIDRAEQLVAPLRCGLALLESDPDRFERFNPKNGWGDYVGLVSFIRGYLAACEKYPGTTVSVSR